MTISNEVRLYLKNKPYIVEALESDIVNVSALARMVEEELGFGKKAHNAVKAAIRRFSIELKKKWRSIDLNAIKVLKNNSVTLLDKANVIVSKAKLQLENMAEVEIDKYYIYIVQDIPKKLPDASIVRIDRNCSVVSIHSGINIEETSGFVAFITSILAEQGINIVEFISCYTETMIVVNKIDAIRSYQTISDLIESNTKY